MSVQDEQGKLNLNDLAGNADPTTGEAKMDRLKRLFLLIGIDPNLVDAAVSLRERSASDHG